MRNLRLWVVNGLAWGHRTEYWHSRFLKKKKKKLFIYLTTPGLNWSMWDLQSSLQHTGFFSCSMWDLFPWPGLEPGPPALWVQSLSHWTTREVPMLFTLNCLIYPRTLLFCINFRINLSMTTEKLAGILTGIALNMNQSENWHLYYIESSNPWTQYVSPFI